MKTWACLPLVAALLSGCASGIDTPPHIRGFLFTYTTVPFTPDLHNTPATGSTGNGMGVRVKEPLTGYGVSAEYDANAVGDIARKQGMRRVDFADMETFDVLGIWRTRRLHLYGK